MNMEELIVRFRIEEDDRSSDKQPFSHAIVKANVIEHDQNSKWKNPKSFKVRPRGGINEKKILLEVF